MKEQARNPNIAVKLLDKEYLIACPADAEAELLTAAAYLNDKMKGIKAAGKTIGLERIAIMAALNLSHELQQTREQNDELVKRLQQLNDRLEHALQPTMTAGTRHGSTAEGE